MVLPSQSLLAPAPDPLHLSGLHGAGKATGLVRSVPSLSARHLDRPQAQGRPSQQHPGQLPDSHWSVWLSLRPDRPLDSHCCSSSAYGSQATQTEPDLEPDRVPSPKCTLRSRNLDRNTDESSETQPNTQGLFTVLNRRKAFQVQAKSINQ